MRRVSKHQNGIYVPESCRQVLTDEACSVECKLGYDAISLTGDDLMTETFLGPTDLEFYCRWTKEVILNSPTASEL